MGDYITEEYFLTNNLLMGLLYYTAEMQVLVGSDFGSGRQSNKIGTL